MNSEIKVEKPSPSYLKRSNNGGLFIGLIYVLVLMSILFLALWQSSEIQDKNASLKMLDDRISVLEEQLNLVDESNMDSMSGISASLQFLDKEVRKLWDLSNKRNKVNIAKLSKDFKSQSSELKELALTQTNDQKNINRIKSKLEKLEILVSDITKSNQQNLVMQTQLAELNKNILLLEETVQAFDTYRKQNNEMLREMQLQIANLKLTPQLEN